MSRAVAYVDEFPGSWRVPIAGAVVNFLVIGYIRCYGFLLIAYQEERGYPHSLLLLVFALFYALNGLLAPLAQKLCERWTTRWIAFLGGLIVLVSLSLQEVLDNVYCYLFLSGFGVGIGFSALYSTMLGLTGVCFKKQRTMAVGMCFIGASLGQVTMPVITTYLLDEYMLRGTLLILGAIMSHSCVVALIVPDKIIDKGSGRVLVDQGKVGSKKDTEAASNWFILKRILPMMPIVILVNFGYSNQHPVFPSFAEEYYVAPQTVTFLVSIQGICDLTSRLTISLLADRLGAQGKILCAGVAMMIQSIFIMIMLLFPMLPTFASYVMVYGFTGGVYYVLWTVVLAIFVESTLIPRTVSLALMVADIFHLPSTYLIGYLRDNLDSYAPLIWVFAGCMGTAGLLLLFFLTWVVHRMRRRSEREKEEKIPLLISRTQRDKSLAHGKTLSFSSMT